MAGLERRLAWLEVRAGAGGAARPVILVRFVGVDGTNPPVQSAACGLHISRRTEGEAEDAFCRRVASEVEGGTGGPGARVVFLA